ncbi:hypothetical protein V1505DRAFT_423502 [Lipomyces doorenjongii]
MQKVCDGDGTKRLDQIPTSSGAERLGHALRARRRERHYDSPRPARLDAAVSTPYEHWAKAAEWASPLQDLLATACDEDTKDNPGNPADSSPLYMLPVGHRWEHRTGATLVGDAAHLMTPWAGEGVNLALWDSLDLAYALGRVLEAENAATWQAALEPRIREYEETMLLRAKEKAEETANNKDMFLPENGGQSMADMFKVFENMAAAGRLPEGQ